MMIRGGGGGGRESRGGTSARSNVSTVSTSASVRGRRATDRHDVLEYNELINYMPEVELTNDEDLNYYESCKNDLRITLLVSKSGVRVRDIRSQFRNIAGYEIDLDRLKLKSWAHFILSCPRMIDLQLDSHPTEDKETLYAFISDYGRREIHGTTRDMQSMINCTPDEKNCPNRFRLVPMTAREAYMKGFLDCAEGVARVDPRVPIQDLGVAASETLRKMRNKKLTFEEQMAMAKANQAKVPTMTVETTEPLPETQTSSVASVFDWMDKLEAAGGSSQTVSNLDFPRPAWEMY